MTKQSTKVLQKSVQIQSQSTQFDKKISSFQKRSLGWKVKSILIVMIVVLLFSVAMNIYFWIKIIEKKNIGVEKSLVNFGQNCFDCKYLLHIEQLGKAPFDIQAFSIPDCYINHNGTIPLDPSHSRNLGAGYWKWIWDAIRQIFIRQWVEIDIKIENYGDRLCILFTGCISILTILLLQ